jgi:hypothetical protein
MAADGDMYVQRKAWGYNRLCAAVCDNAPTQKLAEIETQNVRNMLGNGFAVPSLKVSVEQAFGILESPNIELGFESACVRFWSHARPKALEQKHPWQALATDFPDLYEVENALGCDGKNEQEIRGSLLQLLRNHVAEWKAFNGRAALNRYLIAA